MRSSESLAEQRDVFARLWDTRRWRALFHLLLNRPGARLHLVDGTLEEQLERVPARSVTGFALSNIAEWLDAAGIERLFRAVLRAAAPGAAVVFRNFTGWTEVPAQLAGRIVEDRRFGEQLIARDRSGLQRRIAVCRVEGP